MMTPESFKSARLSLKLTQADAARLLGYGSKTRIAEIEAGRRAPGAAVVLLLRAYLAGYRPTDWPARPPVTGQPTGADASPTTGPAAMVALPVSEAAMRKVADAMRRGIRKPGEIARATGLGLLTVQDAMAAIAALPRPAPVIKPSPKRRTR